MTEYFIGLTLPPNLSRQLDEWREKFYPGSAKRHPPHLTVVPPFAWPSVEEDLTDLDQFAHGLPKISLHFQGTGTIPGNEKIFCIRLDKSDQLVELRQRLMVLTHAEVRQGFEPHISLAKIKEGDFKNLEDYFRAITRKQDVERRETGYFPAQALVIFRGHTGTPCQAWRSYDLPQS